MADNKNRGGKKKANEKQARGKSHQGVRERSQGERQEQRTRVHRSVGARQEGRSGNAVETPPRGQKRKTSSKSMLGKAGERKLAAGHGRASQKSGGESQKKTRMDPRESRKRSESSK